MTNATPLATLLLTVGAGLIEQPVPFTEAIATSSGQTILANGLTLLANLTSEQLVPDPNNNGWDLCLDIEGNIAVAQPPYAVAQDVASAQRTFQGEVWYDTTLGIPYTTYVLGEAPSAALIKSFLQNAALAVPGVVTAKTYLTGINNRTLTGQTQITDTTGSTQVVGF